MHPCHTRAPAADGGGLGKALAPAADTRPSCKQQTIVRHPAQAPGSSRRHTPFPRPPYRGRAF
eukprot:2028550-Prymnesium_polylepis.1